VLAELMKRVPDVVAKIIAEKGGVEKVEDIVGGDLTFNKEQDKYYII
jgi:hypothetical protein